MTRRFRFAAPVIAALVALSMVAVVSANGAGGVTGPAFYVDGVQYRTVDTPTDFSNTGAPIHSYDVIYDLGGHQLNVAEAAPGDRDYNGGRWLVHGVSFNSSYEATLAAHDMDGDGVLSSAEEVESALADAGASGATDLGVVASFECPVIKMPRGRR
ncbi:MAG: hypothetical protein WD208_00815 [Dehalococcoidia bacterium]